MNTAVLQGTIMATTSHGIHRINRHANRSRNRHFTTTRIANYLNQIKSEYALSILNRTSLDIEDPLNGMPFTSPLNDPNDPGSSIAEVSDEKKMGIIIPKLKDTEELFNVNVGGVRFVYRIDTLIHRNQGLLSSLANLPHEKRLPHVDAYFQETNEYYFERHPLLFYSVFQFYLLGRIHHPPEICPQDIMEEFKYWEIDPSPFLCPWCCMDSDDEDEYEKRSDTSTQNIDEFKNLKFGPFRRCVWRIIEEPASSVYAQIFAIFSVLFVLISISGLVLGSIPDFQVAAKKSKTSLNVTLEREPHPILIQVEYVCIIWFSLEYFSKMLVTPNRWATFRQLLNIIDLLAILPFMIEMGLKIIGIDTEQLQDLKGAFLVIRILRVLRVIRVLKLGRYSSGLQMFGKTLHASFRQLGMMAMVVMTGVIFFSTLVYFLEKDDPTSGFHSIPAACWWCIVTMTTVGYGDLTPVTVAGKLVATGAIACGVLVLALPITIIVDNFMKVAESERRPGFSENTGVKRLGPRARVLVSEDPDAQQQQQEIEQKSIRKRKLIEQISKPIKTESSTPMLKEEV
uniref:Uncharacterized protein n=1 Tax=Panagrolaimus superbus TaxID=310955 RepID=A0A914XT16_9BILA